MYLSTSKLTVLALPQDVLLGICRLLATANGSEVYDGLTPPRGLVSLASSCRYLSQIALDALWHTLESPRPLLCALPADLFAFVPVETVADGERNYGVHKAVRRGRLLLICFI